jgi:nucleoside-diphosphate-sugar epimerase
VRVALTGATGFVGSHLVEALTARGDEVACLVRRPQQAEALQKSGARLITGTLEDEAALRALAEGADVLYHVAGAVTSAGQSDRLERVNLQGTEAVVRAAGAMSVPRLVHVSSLAASGPSVAGLPLADTTQCRPVTDYGRSKLRGEEAVRAGRVPFTIVRPPSVYGPRDRQFLPAFRMARRGLVPVLGDGKQELSFIHVRDLAGALIAAGASPQAAGQTYHAAHPGIVTQRELARAIGRAVGRRVAIVPIPGPALVGILHVVGTAADLVGARTVLRPGKAAELLAPAWTCATNGFTADTGWRAEIDLDRGLQETAAWYRQAGWL